jgi:hypothetical protein
MSETVVLEGVLHFAGDYDYLSLDDASLGDELKDLLPYENKHDIGEFLDFGRMRITIERLTGATA